MHEEPYNYSIERRLNAAVISALGDNFSAASKENLWNVTSSAQVYSLTYHFTTSEVLFDMKPEYI